MLLYTIRVCLAASRSFFDWFRKISLLFCSFQCPYVPSRFSYTPLDHLYAGPPVIDPSPLAPAGSRSLESLLLMSLASVMLPGRLKPERILPDRLPSYHNLFPARYLDAVVPKQ